MACSSQHMLYWRYRGAPRGTEGHPLLYPRSHFHLSCRVNSSTMRFPQETARPIAPSFNRSRPTIGTFPSLRCHHPTKYPTVNVPLSPSDSQPSSPSSTEATSIKSSKTLFAPKVWKLHSLFSIPHYSSKEPVYFCCISHSYLSKHLVPTPTQTNSQDGQGWYQRIRPYRSYRPPQCYRAP